MINALITLVMIVVAIPVVIYILGYINSRKDKR